MKKSNLALAVLLSMTMSTLTFAAPPAIPPGHVDNPGGNADVTNTYSPDNSNINTYSPSNNNFNTVAPRVDTDINNTANVNVNPHVNTNVSNFNTISPRVDNEVNNVNHNDLSNRNSNSNSSFNTNLNDLSNRNSNESRNINDLNNSQHQGQGQDQSQSANNHQGQRQNASSDQNQNQNVNDSGNSNQSQSANNAGNSQSTTYNNPRQYRNAPGITSIMGTPGINCMATYALSVSAPGFGVGTGVTSESAECNLREVTRVLHTIGEQDTAIEVMCTSKYVANTVRCQAIRQAKADGIVAKQQASVKTTKVIASSDEGTDLVLEDVVHVDRDNLVVREGNTIKDLQTGKVYGYVRSNGTYMVRNSASSEHQIAIQQLIVQ